MNEKMPNATYGEHVTDTAEFQAAVDKLQFIVNKKIQDRGLSVDDLRDDEILEMTERLNQSLAFEFAQSEELYKGMAVAFEFGAAIIVSEPGSAEKTMEQLGETDMVCGIVRGVSTHIVPSINALLRSEQVGLTDMNPNERSISAAFKVENTAVYYGVNSEGQPSKTQNLDNCDVFVPLVYTPRCTQALV